MLNKKVKKIPTHWIDASSGGVNLYHVKDLAIYIKYGYFEVHNLNITKSKFSLLLKTDNWLDVICFVDERKNND